MYKTTSVGKNVLVAMTGRMDSTVAAYLLKKQGFNPIGIGFSFYNSVEVDKYGHGFVSPHYLPSLEEVKAICDSLEMSFYAVNAVPQFKSLVLDRAVSSRMTGEYFNIQSVITKIMIQELIARMESLKAIKVATGHYARIQYNSIANDYQLLAANDLSCDQSYELASLDQHELSHLLLPLADTRLVEVEKISQTMGVKLLPSIRGLERCESFFTSEAFTRYTIDQVPHSLVRKGPIIDRENDTFCADHLGVHHFYFGQSELKGDMFSLDPRLKIIEIQSNRGVIYVGQSNDQWLKRCYLREFSGTCMDDTTLPLSGFIKFSPCGDKYPCYAFFKNNSTVLIELEAPINLSVAKGQFAVLYAKNSVAAKVLGGGIVRMAGDIEVLNRVEEKNKDDFAADDDEKSKKKEVRELYF